MQCIRKAKILNFHSTRVTKRKCKSNDCCQTGFYNRNHCQLHCCLCRFRKLSDFIKNYLICVPKHNECLTGLERYEAE